MIKNEYFTVKELSKKHKVCARNIRLIIDKIKSEVSPELLHKDKSNQWRIHHILNSRFARKNQKRSKYYALSIDPCVTLTKADVDTVIEYVMTNMEEPDLELFYVAEHKVSNGRLHLHCYTNCKHKRQLIEAFRVAFSGLSYHESAIFDLSGWQAYMQKNNNTIKKITSNEK